MTHKSQLPSREETYIKKYLDDLGIKYVEEYEVHDLKGDSKSHRRVDFYLPRYNIYLEYFGLYNSTKQIRANYDEKVQVYFKNHKPSIFLYPHELGILDYAFHTKMISVLKHEKFYSFGKFIRYKTLRYATFGKGYQLLSALLWWFLFYIFSFAEMDMDEGFIAIISLVSMFAGGILSLLFLGNLYKYFIENE